MTLSDQIDERIKILRGQLEKLERLKYLAAAMGISECEDAVVYQSQVDWNSPKRERFAELRQHFPKGTKWQKDYNGDTVNYQTQIDGIAFRMWQTEPPPSCKVVYEEVLIPARVERVGRLVCKEESEPHE